MKYWKVTLNQVAATLYPKEKHKENSDKLISSRISSSCNNQTFVQINEEINYNFKHKLLIKIVEMLCN